MTFKFYWLLEWAERSRCCDEPPLPARSACYELAKLPRFFILITLSKLKTLKLVLS
jgi:hypothetical protein